MNEWMFKQLYQGAESCVRVNGWDSEWSPINGGFRQSGIPIQNSSIASSTTWCQAPQKQIQGVLLGKHALKDLKYADDTRLLIISAKPPDYRIQDWTHSCQRWTCLTTPPIRWHPCLLCFYLQVTWLDNVQHRRPQNRGQPSSCPRSLGLAVLMEAYVA